MDVVSVEHDVEHGALAPGEPASGPLDSARGEDLALLDTLPPAPPPQPATRPRTAGLRRGGAGGLVEAGDAPVGETAPSHHATRRAAAKPARWAGEDTGAAGAEVRVALRPSESGTVRFADVNGLAHHTTKRSHARSFGQADDDGDAPRAGEEEHKPRAPAADAAAFRPKKKNLPTVLTREDLAGVFHMPAEKVAPRQLRAAAAHARCLFARRPAASSESGSPC